MGVSGLSAWIKEASNGTEEDLTTRTCHVDFAAMFFALLNSHAFYDTITFEAKQARRQFSSTVPAKHLLSPFGSVSSSDTSGTSTPTGSAMVTTPHLTSTSLVTNLETLLRGQPAQIFLNGNGELTTTAFPEKCIVSILYFQT
jgi:hypothetical protein